MKKALRVLVLVGFAVLLSTMVVNAAPPAPKNFVAHLSGGQEVPAVTTTAQGQFIAHLSADGTELHYRLIVANIENVRMAHIHIGPAGTNGPIVVWLYPSAPPPRLIAGRSNGILAEGTVTDADLTGPLAGMTMADLVHAMKSGNAYVNVHTAANPGGEVRGQIRVAGPSGA